jgi:hypothetical protein
MQDRIAYQGITFDDVLLEPAYSEVVPRDVDVRTQLTRNIRLPMRPTPPLEVSRGSFPRNARRHIAGRAVGSRASRGAGRPDRPPAASGHGRRTRRLAGPWRATRRRRGAAAPWPAAPPPAARRRRG